MSIIETAKAAIELAKKGVSVELQETLMEMREQAVQLQEENLALRNQIRELEEAMAIRGNILWDERSRVYWLKGADGEKKEGPYCTRCWDVNKLLVRLQQYVRSNWTCLECRNVFEIQ